MLTETKEEFEAGYIERSKITREFYNEHFTTIPCTNCSFDTCTGWAVVCKGKMVFSLNTEDSTKLINGIQTWAQGYFVDQNKYSNWTPEEKAEADKLEKHLVRPHPTGNAICKCFDPQDAKWISSRLNLASVLEQMAYDYATGKTDGNEIIELIKNNID